MVPDPPESEILAFLEASAGGCGHGPVEVITTHISRIVLAGDRAFKLKRAVRLPYVDFSTPALRLAACEKEVALNSVTAPELYRGVRRITRGADGALAFDGGGPLVDAVVEMSRFDQSALLDRMAEAGTLTPGLMTGTARMIEQFHRGASVIHAGGGAANMAAVLDVNRAGFGASRVFDRIEVEQLDAAFRATLERHAETLDRREREGRIRRCHGDLHLRNICLLAGRPHLFDCIEFNDRIATVDVLYDLAFLLMDLWHRRLPALANLVMNRYLDAGEDEEGLALLPFFMAVRAAVRAHVTATQADIGDGDAAAASEARQYFRLAAGLLDPPPPRLIAIGGFSGSGKSTVAAELAPRVGAPPGARIVESDRIRKALHGVTAETRLPPEAYRPAVSERVYAAMVRRTDRLLASGAQVVVNAVFDRGPDRLAIAAAATTRKVPFAGFWLDAPEGLLRERVKHRRDGASDATVEVLALQMSHAPDTIAWRKIDAARPPAEVADDILATATDPSDPA